MKLRLTETAARQLDRILTDIAQQHPPGARNVQAAIRAAMHRVQAYPYAGQATGRRDIRRMVVSSDPYVLFYRVGDGEIVIRTVRQTSRRPLA